MASDETLGIPKVRLADCRDCYLPIVFVHLTSGKLLPCNPIPDPNGIVAAAVIGGALHGYRTSEHHPQTPHYPYRLALHFATCEGRDPDAPAPEPELPEPRLF